MAKFIITIDGPAGSGKSTVARVLAEKIGAKFLDTGAMYRAVTLAAMKKTVQITNEKQLMNVLENSKFEFAEEKNGMKIFIDGTDFTEQIRDEEVTNNVRHIADSQRLRQKLVDMQRDFAAKTSQALVTEGRDQGTVAFRDADMKFYLTANSDERAKRRFQELQKKGCEVDFQKIKKAIGQRDTTDRNRAVGSLTCADDAIVVDTTKLTVEDVVEKLADYIKRK